jgi:iron(III) transport system substrate-binding protein
MALALVAVLYAMSRQWLARPATVVVYSSQDQVYSEPILQAFEKHTGIQVRAVYDSEAVKTVGLVNRLVAEREHPQCDVFWNNEEMRMHQLEVRDVLDLSRSWVSLGYRSRRIVVNTNLLTLAEAPKSFAELTNAVWYRRVALAYPLFGTTATHFLALRQHWGDEAWQAWCRSLRANDPLVVDGNSVVVRMVGRGEVSVGLTDSDDIAAGQREGLPVAALPLSDESLLIPNTAAIIRGAPRAASAARLIDYLQRPETVLRLVESNALEAMTPPEPSAGLQPDWDALLEHLEEDTVFLKEVFLR